MVDGLLSALALALLPCVPSAAFTPSTHTSRESSSLAAGRSATKSVGGARGLRQQSRACPSHVGRRNNRIVCYRGASALHLVPFSEAWDARIENDNSEKRQSFASLLPSLGCRAINSEGMLIRNLGEENERYRLYLATDADDLPPITKLTLDVFDASAITLSSTSDWSALEQAMVGAVVQPAIGMYNAYAAAVGYTEVLSGLRRRMRNRLTDDGDDANGDYDWLAPLVVPDAISSDAKEATVEEIAARSSLILALARPSGEDTEVVASVELRLQPTDAKIPFSQPWLDKLERRLVNAIPFVKGESIVPTTNKGKASDRETAIIEGNGKSPPLRPYLCNLCVSPSLRSLGIGRALCRILEAIARQRWGYSHMYLHVDPSNEAACRLYEKEGYVHVGRRWNVLWAGGAQEISYYVKRLG